MQSLIEAPAPLTPRPARGQVLPNFLIVGSMKAGTDALAHYLREHPDVYMPPGEIYFFSHDRSWRAGPDSYARVFAGWDGEPAIGEKTATYSYWPVANPSVPARIARLLPRPRLIWCLRSPVERAYSHYMHAVRRGREPWSFERALAIRTRPDDRAYLDRGIYVDQVRLYLEHFSLEQILFVRFEDLVGSPNEVLRRTFEFLGVDPSFRGERVGESRNAAWVPRSRLLQFGIRTAFETGIHPAIRPGRTAEWLMRRNRSRDSGYPPMKAETRAFLSSFYRDHNVALANLIGIDVSSWT